jgi:hypothetical protein
MVIVHQCHSATLSPPQLRDWKDTDGITQAGSAVRFVGAAGTVRSPADCGLLRSRPAQDDDQSSDGWISRRLCLAVPHMTPPPAGTPSSQYVY